MANNLPQRNHDDPSIDAHRKQFGPGALEPQNAYGGPHPHAVQKAKIEAGDLRKVYSLKTGDVYIGNLVDCRELIASGDWTSDPPQAA